jgi:hypothetical protein
MPFSARRSDSKRSEVHISCAHHAALRPDLKKTAWNFVGFTFIGSNNCPAATQRRKNEEIRDRIVAVEADEVVRNRRETGEVRSESCMAVLEMIMHDF